MREKPSDVVFYRAMIDGWHATHAHLHSWLRQHHPRLDPTWAEFRATGLISQDGAAGWLSDLTKRPSDRDIHDEANSAGPGSAAALAFLLALYDLADFANAAPALAIVTARWLGVTMCDDE
jgi:hypothetical protein